jgi:hypothetical protein
MKTRIPLPAPAGPRSSPAERAASLHQTGVPPIACSIEDAPSLIGVSRTRIFNAVRKNDLTARKAGRSTIIELEELRRWVKSLPTKGRANSAKVLMEDCRD